MATTSQQTFDKKWKRKDEIKKLLKNGLSGRGYAVVSPTDFQKSFAGFFGVHVSEDRFAFVKPGTIPIRGLVSFLKSKEALLIEVTTTSYVSRKIKGLFAVLCLLIMGISSVGGTLSGGALCCAGAVILMALLLSTYHFMTQSKANEKRVNQEVHDLIEDLA
ncbi:hypothetical protein JW721_06375 [Candidatus Micrarchaeota archaeon]|nr:hypothetical protein [Candidatus Micrarchaeota archaeon]